MSSTAFNTNYNPAMSTTTTTATASPAPSSSFAFAQPPAGQYQYQQTQYQQQQQHSPSAPPPQQQQQQQAACRQQQLVPMYGPPPPPATNPGYYSNNYSFDAQQPRREPSIYTVSPVAGSRPLAPPPTAATTAATTVDLLDDFIGASSSSSSSSNTATATTTSARPLFSDSQARALEQARAEARDHEFVSSLGPEVLDEQRRIYDEIQARSGAVTSSSSSNNQMTVRDDYSNTQLVTAPPTNLVVPRSDNPTGSDAVVPSKYRMKSARKVKMGAGAVGGAVVGGVLFGPAWPIGVVAGGAAGAYGTKQVAKVSERRAQRKYEKRSVQQQASSSIIATRGGDATAFA